MSKSYDVIVVGGGAVGASALFRLAERGITNTLLIEGKKNLGRGSTGSWGSLIRVYHRNPRTTALAAESVPFYLDFKRHVGRDAGYVRTGSLYFLKRHCLELIKNQMVALNKGTLKLEIIEAAEGKRRYPNFHWWEDDFAIYESHSGYACPWATTDAWVDSARDAGAELETDNAVVDFLTENNRVTGVVTRRGDEFLSDKVVLATGAWSPALCLKLGIELPIVSRVIQVNHFHRQVRENADPFFIDLEALTFGRPAPDGSFVGGCMKEESESADTLVQSISLREAHEAKRRLSTRVNWIKNASILGGVRAVEAYTGDLNGHLEYSAKYENLLIAVGWSCTGFTLAPVIGQRIAESIEQKGVTKNLWNLKPPGLLVDAHV